MVFFILEFILLLGEDIYLKFNLQPDIHMLWEFAMLELYLIRHGLAGKSLADQTSDEKRPLSKKGKEKMKEIAKGLKKLDICFEMVLTSPLIRAKETAEIVQAYCGATKKVSVTSLLKPGSSYDNLIKFLNKYKKHQRIALVGHEPFLSGFASYCLAQSENSFINLKKGGILVLENDAMIKPGECVLTWLMEPGQIIQQKNKT